MIALPPEVYSQHQVSQVILELRSYVGKMNDHAVRSKVAHIIDEITPGLSSLPAKTVRANNIRLSDLSMIERLIKELELVRSSAPTAHMVLAANPADSIRFSLSSWFRTAIHPQLLLSFAVRPDIGGGAILRIGSHQYDFTYRTHLMNNKAHMQEVLQRAEA